MISNFNIEFYGLSRKESDDCENVYELKIDYGKFIEFHCFKEVIDVFYCDHINHIKKKIKFNFDFKKDSGLLREWGIEPIPLGTESGQKT